jgi:carbon storage regulator CsrA
MLVLTRKHQEKIRIGDNIVITVLKTKGKAVRLGIEAPMEVPVIRGELKFESEVAADELGDAEEISLKLADLRDAPRATKKERSHTDRVKAHWPAKTEPVNGALPPGSTSRVTLERLSREQLGQVLPKMAAGSAPLRAMLDRRSVSV